MAYTNKYVKPLHIHVHVYIICNFKSLKSKIFIVKFRNLRFKTFNVAYDLYACPCINTVILQSMYISEKYSAKYNSLFAIQK